MASDPIETSQTIPATAFISMGLGSLAALILGLRFAFAAGLLFLGFEAPLATGHPQAAVACVGLAVAIQVVAVLSLALRKPWAQRALAAAAGALLLCALFFEFEIYGWSMVAVSIAAAATAIASESTCAWLERSPS